MRKEKSTLLHKMDVREKGKEPIKRRIPFVYLFLNVNCRRKSFLYFSRLDFLLENEYLDTTNLDLTAYVRINIFLERNKYFGILRYVSNFLMQLIIFLILISNLDFHN